MRISIRLYRNKDLDIMNFLYNPNKERFDTSLVRDILKDYTNGYFKHYPVNSIEDPNVFPATKLLSVTIKDEDEDIINILKSIHNGMGNIFIKSLIRKYSDIASLQIFRTDISLIKYEPMKKNNEFKRKTIIKDKELVKETAFEEAKNISLEKANKLISDVPISENNLNDEDENDFWDDLNNMMQIF